MPGAYRAGMLSSIEPQPSTSRVRIHLELDFDVKSESGILFTALGRILGKEATSLTDLEELVAELFDNRWMPLLTLVDADGLLDRVPGLESVGSTAWIEEIDDES